MIEDAVAEFRGTYLQQPPVFSAKKIDGDRAYDLARRNAPVQLQPVRGDGDALDVVEWRGTMLTPAAGVLRRLLRARRWLTPLGERLGTGGHLAGLVRTRSGDFTLADAVGLDMLDRRPHEAAARIIPLAALLPSLPAITLTPEGASLAARGGFIGPSQVACPSDSPPRQAVCGSCTRTGTWSPSPSLAQAGTPAVSCVIFCIPASYWTKITRLGLTHCGGLGSVSPVNAGLHYKRSAGPRAEECIRGTQ